MATTKKSSGARKRPLSGTRSSPRSGAKTTAKSSTKSAARKPVKRSAAKARGRSKATAADSVDEQLARYRSMRDFSFTDEPSGGPKKKSPSTPALSRRRDHTQSLPFVIQKHAASHLHYDFRLAWNGVLKSWAVAKGPSYYPGDRRLAVQVEDHPMEYGGFEGIIPKGQYGGGTVMVWDQGSWWPQPGYEDVTAALRNGSLKFEMDGTKMHGKWTLVRMNPRSTSSSGSRWGSSSKPNWLLIKEHDDFERGPKDPPITEEAQDSAVTGRTMDEIAHASDHVWNSNKTAGSRRAWYRREAPPGMNGMSENRSRVAEPAPGAKFEIAPQQGRKKTSASAFSTRPGQQPGFLSEKRTNASVVRSSIAQGLSHLPAETQPAFVPPQLAEESSSTPDGAEWLHEIKLDGYRIQARKSGSRVQLLTRKGLDWTHRMRPVAEAVAALPADKLTLDGEVVVLDEHGISSFANLQASFNEGARYPLTYFVFDLLHLDGHNTRNLTTRERKQLLAKVLPPDSSGTVRFSEHIDGSGPEIFAQACKLGTEGIVSKYDAPYRSGRSSDWLKSKCLLEQEFVIAGFTNSTEGPGRIGSLILGVYEHATPRQSSSPVLLYTGRTGTGFTQKMKRELYARLHKLETGKMPYAQKPAGLGRNFHWVQPKLVAQVRFASWTADNLVRQAAFLGLREDKSPQEVVREEASVKPKSARTPSTHPSKSASRKAVSDVNITTASKASSLDLPDNIRLTHPDKVLDPESGLTKRQLAAYYWAVADRMLPHIAGRPLSLVRCPEGASKPCFFQKHVNAMLPPGIGSVMVTDKKSGKPEPYITLDTRDALVSLAQMSVLEVHPWGSRNDDLEHPDRIIFDLDPDEAISWETLCEAAAEIRKRLKRAGLESFLKTTGGKGLHVVAPIEPRHDWATLKDAAHNLVLHMERDNPERYLTKMTKSARRGKIYLDYLRNERGATAVAPFSPRARLGATISLPLPWTALKLPSRPVFHVTDLESPGSGLRERLRTDPWKALPGLRQRLDPKAFASR